MKMLMQGMLAIAILAMCAAPLTAKGHKGKGPHEKATGGLMIMEGSGMAEVGFNAHETDPAKGEFYWNLNDGERVIKGTVTEASVDGNEAMFTVEATYDTGDTQVGKLLKVKVVDGGTPARNGDSIGWYWTDTGSDYNAKTITAGNLVVHYND
jgi:hypothetical protein